MSEELSLEVEAARIGWQPLDSFKGNPERWVDAQEFLDRGKIVLPLLRKTNERLTNEVASLRQDVTRTQQLLTQAQEAMSEFRQYHEEDSKRQYERALASLKADKKTALAEQDFDTVVEIDEAIQSLKPAVRFKEPEPLPQADPAKDPVFVQWVKDSGSWYGPDKEKTLYANASAQYLRATQPELRGREFLDAVGREVEEKFGTPARSDKVEGSRGGATQSRGGGHSYSDLPADAKQACERFAKRLVGTKAYPTLKDWQRQYTQDYFGSSE